MTCLYTHQPCPYVGIGSGCRASGCPELDYEEPEMETYYDEDGYLIERIKEAIPQSNGGLTMNIGTLTPNTFMLDNGDKSLGIKSPTLWGVEDGKIYPLIFFRKPKHIKQEDFEILMNKIQITIKG